ncbi:MAG: NUDIX domain-containing protein [Candidatus Pacebacteria bacterium]|nr:NUDIX domain-containing protein [Candidatus Paceibacterota bacterium]MCF7862650.1 NUDIX domain-containing protein [Candidatus Paceibacterota bacterium]
MKKVDFTVEVFIVFQNKVLLRLHEKLGKWISVGGHIEQHENPIEAAKREVMEEVGLEVELFGHHSNISDEDHYEHLLAPRFLAQINNLENTKVVSVYFAKTNNDKLVLERDTDQIRWVGIKELDEMDIEPNICFYAKEALKELGELG